MEESESAPPAPPILSACSKDSSAESLRKDVRRTEEALGSGSGTGAGGAEDLAAEAAVDVLRAADSCSTGDRMREEVWGRRGGGGGMEAVTGDLRLGGTKLPRGDCRL